MADGRSREAWNHTSALLAMLANLHRDRKKRPLQPADFHPYARAKSKGALPKAPITLLKTLFVDRLPFQVNHGG